MTAINRVVLEALVLRLVEDFLFFEDDKSIAERIYEVESEIDEEGGVCFNNLDKAIDYFETLLDEQTNVDHFDCEDFEKVDFFKLWLHLTNSETTEQESYSLIQADRKSDTEFQLGFREV